MSAMDMIESSFKSLKQRTEDALDTIENVNRQCIKTTNGMNDLCDTIRDMRERVRAVMSIQDGLTFHCKGIDKIMLGTVDMSFAAEPIQHVPRRKKDQESDKEDGLSEDEYTPESTSTKPVMVSDEKISSDISDEGAPESMEEEQENIDIERLAAQELENQLDKEFEADEETLRVAEGNGMAEKETMTGDKLVEENMPKDVDELDEPKAVIAEVDVPTEIEGAATKVEGSEVPEEGDEEAMSDEEARKIAEIELRRLAEEEEALLKEEEEELRRLEEEEALLAEEEEIRKLEEAMVKEGNVEQPVEV